MKKITLTLVLALFTFTFVNAQVEIKPGIKAGLNFSDFTSLNNVNNSSGGNGRTSFHVGAVVNFKFTDIYTLAPEVLYSEQGAELNVNSLGSTSLNANYLSIAVNNKFYIGGGKFNLQIAPVLDFLISDENIIDPEGFDLGVMGGIGYDFPFGMTADIRYKQGLVDLFGRNVNNSQPIEDIVLNQVFLLSLGYQFDF